MSQPQLLMIVELGGYPNFEPLYRQVGCQVEKVHSMRKAQAWLKKNKPDVIVAEFHFDPELRDRMSNLESLIATLQRYQAETRVIVFIDAGHRSRLVKLQERFPVFAALDYPIDESKLTTALEQALAEHNV
ncbi:MAG: hypothetical protein MI754_00850 [Chromatiales bacterium]|nr:hypothetical protein [Chromatiales bacterium]